MGYIRENRTEKEKPAAGRLRGMSITIQKTNKDVNKTLFVNFHSLKIFALREREFVVFFVCWVHASKKKFCFLVLIVKHVRIKYIKQKHFFSFKTFFSFKKKEKNLLCH